MPCALSAAAGSTGPAVSSAAAVPALDQILAMLKAQARQVEAIRADTEAIRARTEAIGAETAALSKKLQDLKQANPEALGGVKAVGGVKRKRPQVRSRFVHSRRGVRCSRWPQLTSSPTLHPDRRTTTTTTTTATMRWAPETAPTAAGARFVRLPLAAQEPTRRLPRVDRQQNASRRGRRLRRAPFALLQPSRAPGSHPSVPQRRCVSLPTDTTLACSHMCAHWSWRPRACLSCTACRACRRRWTPMRMATTRRHAAAPALCLVACA